MADIPPCSRRAKPRECSKGTICSQILVLPRRCVCHDVRRGSEVSISSARERRRAMGKVSFCSTVIMFAVEAISFAANCQSTTGERDSEQIGAILTQTRYWTVEHLAAPTMVGGVYAPLETLSFTKHENRWQVTISYGYRGTCVTDVTLQPDGFTYTGCFFGDRNYYRFDPKTKKYSFRTGDGPWAKRLTSL